MGSGLSGAFAVDGSMSRTAAADGAGAKSQMVSIIAAIAILITAAALTGLFQNLPEATPGSYRHPRGVEEHQLQEDKPVPLYHSPRFCHCPCGHAWRSGLRVA